MRLKLNQRIYNIRSEKINAAVGKDLASKIKQFAKIFIVKAKTKKDLSDKNHLQIKDF